MKVKKWTMTAKDKALERRIKKTMKDGGKKLMGEPWETPAYLRERERAFANLSEFLVLEGGQDVQDEGTGLPHLIDIKRLLARGEFMNTFGLKLRSGGLQRVCHGNVERLSQIGERPVAMKGKAA